MTSNDPAGPDSAATQLIQGFEQVETDRARLWFEQARMVREMDRLGIATTVGASSLKAFLIAAFRVSPAEAAALIDGAANLVATGGLADQGQPRLPATAAAVAAGDIGPSHVQVITQALDRLPGTVSPAEREWAEQVLADQATQLGPADLVRAGQAVHNRLDPDGQLPRDAARRRELTFSREYDGMVRLRGRLDPEGAAVVRAALDPLSAPRPEDADGKDTRPAPRRWADALVDLADRALRANDLPDAGGERPQLRVTIPFSALRGGGGLGETEWGDFVDAGTARRLACDAQLIPAVLGSADEPLDIGRATRTVPAGLRRALSLRDRGCAFPGCDRPSAWADAHHVVHWCDGGVTSLGNLVLLCGFHHRVVHQQHWQIKIVDHVAWFQPVEWSLLPCRTCRKPAIRRRK